VKVGCTLFAHEVENDTWPNPPLSCAQLPVANPKSAVANAAVLASMAVS